MHLEWNSPCIAARSPRASQVQCLRSSHLCSGAHTRELRTTCPHETCNEPPGDRVCQVEANTFITFVNINLRRQNPVRLACSPKFLLSKPIGAQSKHVRVSQQASKNPRVMWQNPHRLQPSKFSALIVYSVRYPKGIWHRRGLQVTMMTPAERGR